MADTIRKQILREIVDAFKAVRDTEPSDDPMGISFSVVGLGPLGDDIGRKRAAIGVVPGEENKEEYVYPFIQPLLQVTIEFSVQKDKDDDFPGFLAEDVLGVIQRVMVSDRSWGGRAFDTKEQGSAMDLATYSDRSVRGASFWEIQYRHSHMDTRSLDPN